MSPALTELAVLFFWSFLVATIVSVGSEPALVPLTRSGEPLRLLLLIAAAAGVVKIPFASFSIWVILGKAASY